MLSEAQKAILLRAANDQIGDGVVCRGSGRVAAARALERKGLVRLIGLPPDVRYRAFITEAGKRALAEAEGRE